MNLSPAVDTDFTITTCRPLTEKSQVLIRFGLKARAWAELCLSFQQFNTTDYCSRLPTK